MKRSQLSLKGLEIFQAVARSGSVQAVAEETGLSISTVSHHLRRLEETVGTSLLDHKRRPMVLTTAGAGFQRYVDQALLLIRKAEVEALSGNLATTSSLRLGLIDDFDGEIAPELARSLALGLPNCEFVHYTRPSHEILTLLRNQKLDIGVATQLDSDAAGLIEYPLFRDPYVVATPRSSELSAEDYLSGASDLPLLRYSRDQLIGAQIELQLRRLRISLPRKFEIESNQSIMSMVAEENGWAITTPACYIRAKRFHGGIRLDPFPRKAFARYLSLFTTEAYSQEVAEVISASLRRLIQMRAIDPVLAELPWLADTFHLLPERAPVPGS